MVTAVDRHHGGEGALRPNEDKAIGGLHAVQLFETSAAEDHVGGVGQHRIASERDAELAADRPTGAVAGDHIISLYRFADASRVVDHARRHAGVVLGKVHKLGPVAPHHM